jgi:hypothetical protein
VASAFPLADVVAWIEASVPSLEGVVYAPVELASLNPTYPYATVLQGRGVSVGAPAATISDDPWPADPDLVTHIRTQGRETIVRVRIFGESAYDLMCDLELAQKDPTVEALLLAAEIGVKPVSDAIPTTPQDIKYGEAYYQDWSISHVNTTESGIAWIETVETPLTVS